MGDDADLRAQIAALTAAVQALTSLQSRATVDASKTLSELLALYEATWPREASWRRSLRAMLAPAAKHFGDRPAHSLTRQDWIYYRDKVRALQTTVRKGNPTPYTLNQELGRWRIVCRWAIAEGLLRENPLATVKPLPAKRHRETEPTWEDIAALKAHCTPDTWAMILLGFRRGFRRDEARRLEWRDVDLERGRIRLPAHRVKTREAASMRIPSDVVAALKAIRPEIPGRFVFCSPREPSRPLGKTTIWTRWRNAVDKARRADGSKLQAADGDGRMVFHDTRHGFASNMARKNPLPVAMRMTRHRSLGAAARYLHVNEDDLELAYEKLENDARKSPSKPPEHSFSTETAEQKSPSIRGPT